MDRRGTSGRVVSISGKAPLRGGAGGAGSRRQGGAKMAEAAAAAAGPRVAEAPSSLLLVVGGECSCPGLLNYVLEELERGGAGVAWRGGSGQAGDGGPWGGAAGGGEGLHPGIGGRELGAGGGRIQGAGWMGGRWPVRRDPWAGGSDPLGVRRTARLLRPDPGAACGGDVAWLW